jgi:hypothetical protein
MVLEYGYHLINLVTMSLLVKHNLESLIRFCKPWLRSIALLPILVTIGYPASSRSNLSSCWQWFSSLQLGWSDKPRRLSCRRGCTPSSLLQPLSRARICTFMPQHLPRVTLLCWRCHLWWPSSIVFEFFPLGALFLLIMKEN